MPNDSLYDRIHIRTASPQTGAERLLAAIKGQDAAIPARSAVDLLDQIDGHAKAAGFASGPPPRRRIQRANRATIRAIDEKLAEVCRSNGDGTCEYIDGWSDRAVAESIGPHVSLYSVQYSRSGSKLGQLSGHVKKPKATAQPDAAGVRALALVENLYKLLGQDIPTDL
jgi:hypothetical protein